MSPKINFCLLTFSGCRFDVFQASNARVLKSFRKVYSAQSPANSTLPAHFSFFQGILPNAKENVPYFNRFSKQLIGVAEVGETNVVKNCLLSVRSDINLLAGLKELNFEIVGSAAMPVLQHKLLTQDFDRFMFTESSAENRWAINPAPVNRTAAKSSAINPSVADSSADKQIAFVQQSLPSDRPFFSFINFAETHDDELAARREAQTFKSSDGLRLFGTNNRAVQKTEFFERQVAAVEELDKKLPSLFSKLPGNTIVIACGDHGTAMGEDGWWGYGHNHPSVLEVPLCIFRVDGKPIDGAN